MISDVRAPRSVDVVDDVLFIGHALAVAAREERLDLKVRRQETSWIVYNQRLTSVADVVVLRAELGDHVPTVLKTRALAREGAIPVIVANAPSPAHLSRLAQAGARRVLTQDDSIDDLIDALRFDRAHRPDPAPPDDVRLSDRELQVACLFAGRSAPSTNVLSDLLGIPLSSTRTHLQRARRSLSAGGPTSTREQLHDRLVEGGWMAAPTASR